MQTIPSYSEETDRTDTQTSIPLPQQSSAPSPIDVDSRDQTPDRPDHLSPVFNENNKRPRVESPVVATSSGLAQSSVPPALGPVVGNPGSSTTGTPIPTVIIEGSLPKRAMSEEHLSNRGESPVVNLANGQPGAASTTAGTGNTKLSEVTYPIESTESVDAEMKDAGAQDQTGAKGESQVETAAAPAANKGMKPSERPSLPEQVAIIRGRSSCLCKRRRF